MRQPQQNCPRCGRALSRGDHAACRPAWGPVLMVLAAAAAVVATALALTR